MSIRQLALAAALALAASTTVAGTARADDYWHRDGGYDRAYGYPYRGDDRGWWGYNDGRHGRWKERRYERMKNDDRRGDAERFNNRLCHNGIPGDAPGGCGD